jgi:metal-responsive CopG/Arc/MetJ family transcriptional regulator
VGLSGSETQNAHRKEVTIVGKTLYSLILSDEVVREIDLLAHRTGTNRSNLINQILAEYVNMITPERRITDIFKSIEELIDSACGLVPFVSPNTQTMSLKSSLEYKYRPTVKYEVELFRNGGGALGELSVVFRTQSAALISAMTEFFRLWKRIEDKVLQPRIGGRAPEYALYDGKFVRSIVLPERDCSSEELAKVLSAYVKLFDETMKGYLSGSLQPQDVENRYRSQIDKFAFCI